jgi:hypothetical protein
MVAETSQTFGLDIHGVTVAVTVDDSHSAAEIRSDFSAFLADTAASPTITIAAHFSEPAEQRIPANVPLFRKTKDADIYEAQGIRYLDSSGTALVIWKFATENVDIYSLDRSLLREKAYLVIMSRVGDLLDRRGMHRVHAMGVEYDDRAVICAMAMGGGKTTLTLGLMEKSEFRLLSDEAPLISANGRLYGLPVRLGTRDGTRLNIPKIFLSSFTRSRYPPKTLIDVKYFGKRLAESTEPGIFFVGCRRKAPEPRIEPVNAITAFSALWESCVLVYLLEEYLSCSSMYCGLNPARY